MYKGGYQILDLGDITDVENGEYTDLNKQIGNYTIQELINFRNEFLKNIKPILLKFKHGAMEFVGFANIEATKTESLILTYHVINLVGNEIDSVSGLYIAIPYNNLEINFTEF